MSISFLCVNWSQHGCGDGYLGDHGSHDGSRIFGHNGLSNNSVVKRTKRNVREIFCIFKILVTLRDLLVDVSCLNLAWGDVNSWRNYVSVGDWSSCIGNWGSCVMNRTRCIAAIKTVSTCSRDQSSENDKDFHFD